MYKVFAFLKRNTALLTHDEYRAGHVGHHCCFSRRLKDIRGYLVNISANESLRSKIGPLVDELSWDEPEGFLDLWDGFPQVYFDDETSWRNAGTPEPTRTSSDGLIIDPDWKIDDGPYLFDAVPGTNGEFRSYHLRMHEHCILPVKRPEAKITKLIQFAKRHPSLTDLEYERSILTRYAGAAAQMAGLYGYTVNFRDQDQDAAMRGYYPDDAWCFSEEGQRMRSEFCDLWDTAIELYFDTPEHFVTARRQAEVQHSLLAQERYLFERCWYVEVDENLIVQPNRDPAPDFYFR